MGRDRGRGKRFGGSEGEGVVGEGVVGVRAGGPCSMAFGRIDT